MSFNAANRRKPLLARPATAALALITGLCVGAARGQEQAAIIQKACALDYQSLCAGVQPGGGRILTCFRDNAAKLSAGCKQALENARTASRKVEGTISDPAVNLTFGGVQRTYLVHVPAKAPPASGFPVILAFHGGGTGASSMVYLTNFDPLADERGFIAVYPNGIDGRWNDGRETMKKTDDAGFVSAILDDLEHRYPVDRGRIFATGMSNGALFSERLGCELSDRILAIAPVSGTIPADIAPSCHPALPVSVLQIHGTDDPTAPYKGGPLESFGGLGHGGNILGADETAALWARIDKCDTPPAPVALPPVAPPDGTSVTRTSFASCRLGTNVTLITIDGAGHTWPNGPQYLPVPLVGRTSHQLDGSATIVDFFLSLAPR